MSVNPPPNISTIAFLSDSLKITVSSTRSGIIRNDEHYEKTKRFCDCLLKLRDRNKIDFDPEIFNYFIDRITYADIQKILVYYCRRKNFDYCELIDGLIKTNQGILEGKVVGDIDIFKNVADYLGYRDFNREF